MTGTGWTWCFMSSQGWPPWGDDIWPETWRRRKRQGRCKKSSQADRTASTKAPRQEEFGLFKTRKKGAWLGQMGQGGNGFRNESARLVGLSPLIIIPTFQTRELMHLGGKWQAQHHMTPDPDFFSFTPGLPQRDLFVWYTPIYAYRHTCTCTHMHTLHADPLRAGVGLTVTQHQTSGDSLSLTFFLVSSGAR